MGFIYKATNSANGKSYIGQTKCAVGKRWHEHIREARRNCDNTKINNAIRKYGADSFVVITLEELPDIMLDEREIFWISKLRTQELGYNSTLGGDGSSQADYDVVKRLWDSGLSVRQIISETGYCKATIYAALQTHKTYSGKESVRRGKQNQMRKVCQYDLDGNYIQTFDSMTDAANAYGVDRTLISAVCRRKRHSGAGYQWRYESDSPPSNYISEQERKVPVSMYDSDGGFVASYGSMSDAERITGIRYSAISACCSGKRQTAGGYRWRIAS